MPYAGIIKGAANVEKAVVGRGVANSVNHLLELGSARCRYMGKLIRDSIEKKYKTHAAFEKAAGMNGGSVGSLLKVKRGVIGKVFGNVAKALDLTPKKLWDELEKAPPIKELDDVSDMPVQPAGDEAGNALMDMLKSLKLQDEPKMIIDVPHLGKIELGMASGRWAPVRKNKKTQ